MQSTLLENACAPQNMSRAKYFPLSRMASCLHLVGVWSKQEDEVNKKASIIMLLGITPLAAWAMSGTAKQDQSDNVKVVSGGAKPNSTPYQCNAVNSNCGDPPSGGGGSGGSQAPRASTGLLDYLIQDVCVDGSDNPIAGDPASCSAHRNIRIGELSPYVMSDQDQSSLNVGNGYLEAQTSFPVRGTDGTTKILISKHLGSDIGPNYNFSFAQNRDGYDLLDVNNSAYASYVRTSDPGCFDGMWSGDGSSASMAHRAGGWIVFPFAGDPSSWPLTSHAYTTTYHIELTPGQGGPCANGHSAGVTFWNQPLQYTFETHKVLTAIRSDHFANSNLSDSNNALEKYLYTREYGATRWEAWIPQQRCIASPPNGSQAYCHPDQAPSPLASRCSVMNSTSTGNPWLDTWGNQYWVMVDCRDHTNYVGLNTPQRMVDNVMAQNDGYVDINP